MLISNKLWEFRQNNIDDNIINSISREFKISATTAKIIANRGLVDSERIQKFLKPDIQNFYDPFLMKDMSKAVDRIVKAITNKEKILIYGDYDVDGITSISILLGFIREFCEDAEFYIPDRIEEGYGLSVASIDKVLLKHIDLIITVDCGITAVSEIEYIKSKGVDVIVTDHHECKEIIPDALAVVNPKQKDCIYPFKELAGVGVVFKLIQALAQKMNIENVIDRFIEITAVGTVADVVPLLDENRIIVKYGLEKIKSTSNIGIKALINVAGLQGKPITSTSIGYILAPRINAAGRIGDAKKGVDLFLCEDLQVAESIANELDMDNKSRQQTENGILNEAIEMVLNNEKLSKQKVIVLASEGWHHGVIGIVSSRITEKFYKPSILISLDGESGKGSGRSIEGFNIFEALTGCSGLLEKFGGHDLAVGLSINKSQVDEFREKINKYADEVLHEDSFYPKVKIDAELKKDDIKISLANELKVLEPYGMGNACPVFLYNNLKIVDCKTVGEDRHIKFRMEDEDLYIDAIGFNFGEIYSKVNVFDKVDVACNVESNIWNGQEKVQLNIKDIRTNDNIIFKEKYYSTLENCIVNDLKVINNIALSKIEIYKDNLLSLLKNEQKNIVLINTLKGSRNFIEALKGIPVEIKDSVKLYYNHNISSKHIKNVAVINPYLQDINFEEFENIIMFDLCFSKKQYDYLVSKNKNIYIMNEFYDHSSNIDVFEDIIPQRDELIKVYQYIKSRGLNESINEDIFSLTREIAISYNMDINSLKMKKILEIFEEMKLITMQVENDNYSIQLVKQNGMKVNISESSGLIKLQKIKDEFDYFLNFLNEGQIC